MGSLLLVKRFIVLALFSTSLAFWVQASDEVIDEYDKICADHMSIVFQAYEQSKKNLEIDFLEPIMVSRKIMGVIPFQITRGPVDQNILDGWAFSPIYAKTGLNFSFIKYQKDSLIGMVALNEQSKVITITYRGTQQPSDWFHNINFLRRQSTYVDEGILLNSGYLEVFENSLPSLKEALDGIKSKLDPEDMNNWHVLVTGHSLGGATASIAVSFVRYYFPESSVRLSIFGAPLVGGEDYNAWLMKNNIVAKSFVRQTDPAPWNPSGYGCSYLGSYISLPHYGDWMFAWPMPHDSRKYRRAIYEYLKENYENLSSISLCGMEM